MPDLGEILLKRELDALTERVAKLEKWKLDMQEWFVEVGSKFNAAGED